MNKEALLEGLLFISGSEGLNIDDISKSLNISKEESLELINQLKESLNNDSRGIGSS